MSRIKRQGLDYFPLDINFMMSRPVRRVQKSAGDAAVTVLMYIYTSLYGGEGYYLAADGDYLEYLADLLYGADTGFVERVIREAVKQGLFDERVYREHGVLTSREVQKQYLFCTRRRHSVRLDPRYSLLPPDETSPGEAGAGTCAEAPGMPAETPENARSTGKNAQSTAQHSKATPFLNCSPGSGGTPAAARTAAEEEEALAGDGKSPAAGPRIWTMDDVRRLQPPQDGLKRNFSGLLLNLSLYNVPPQEQYALALKSGFGLIGHPVWRGFEPLRCSRGKIREPGKYLLSLCR